MRVGVPREVKDNEYRVALTPAGVREFVRAGHEVSMEVGAGAGSAIADDEYRAAGARVLDTAGQVWERAELVLKVKEPVEAEYRWLRRDQVLFTFLHLAAAPDCTRALLKAGTTAIAYETVRRDDGSLPLLAPMSEVAGRLATQVGAHHLTSPQGGRGVLLGGVPGAGRGKVVVIGAGTAGLNATAVAVGMRAGVTLLDSDVGRLRVADQLYAGRVRTMVSNSYQVEDACRKADLVIGAVLVPGARAPRLVSSDLVAEMKSGSVLVDVSIDQGGCFEDSRPTTHSDPTFRVHGSVFYCVANMPGAVPHTSTYALTNATLPYALALAAKGPQAALREDATLARGLNIVGGQVTNPRVGHAHGLPSISLEDVLALLTR